MENYFYLKERSNTVSGRKLKFLFIILLMMGFLFSTVGNAAESGIPPEYHLEFTQDSSIILVPNELDYSHSKPLLVILNCTGGTVKDIEDNIAIAESLDWFLAVAKGPRNKRSTALNEMDILNLVQYTIEAFPVDTTRIFVFGFSGMGAQALATVFHHPDIFSGVVSTCGHTGGLQSIDWEKGKDISAYIITRQADWNRNYNEQLGKLFEIMKIKFRLIITPGEHGEGTPEELFEASKWLDAVSGMPYGY